MKLRFLLSVLAIGLLGSSPLSTRCLRGLLKDGTSVTIQAKESSNRSGGSVLRTYQILDREGQLVSSMSPEGETLQIIMVAVGPEERNQGYSTVLFQKALEDAGPQVKSFRGNLEWVNYEVFESAYNALPQTLRQSNPTEALYIGVRATPFYKAVEKLGFTEIREAQPYEEKPLSASGLGPNRKGIRVTISRPAPAKKPPTL